MAPDSRGWRYEDDPHTLTFLITPTTSTFTVDYSRITVTARHDYGCYYTTGWDSTNSIDYAENSRKIKASRRRWLAFTRGNGWEDPLSPVQLLRAIRSVRVSVKPLRKETPRRSRPPRARSFKQVRLSLRKARN
jgi:hypothetical protein